MKRLFIDIEAAPSKAYIWGLKTRYVPLSQVAEDGYILCFSYWWEGDEDLGFYSLWDHGYETMVKAAWDLLDEADHVITFNGKGYDIPMLNTEFLVERLGPPSPYFHTDLYQETKQFRTLSSSMKYYLKILGLDNKLEHKGMELWTGCMDGVKEDQAVMEAYNFQDVEVMPEFYEILLPWLKNVPNETLYMEPDNDGKLRCRCGSKKLRFKGYKHNKTLSYKQYQCGDCGTYMRERFTFLTGPNRRTDVATW
jgi:hypothetical protein